MNAYQTLALADQATPQEVEDLELLATSVWLMLYPRVDAAHELARAAATSLTFWTRRSVPGMRRKP